MQKYDVVIVGGGLGGLVTAVILSKEGKNVCLLEQNRLLGGCLQSFSREGYMMDAGMHYMGCMDQGQTLHHYFKYLGILDDLDLLKLDVDGFDVFRFSDGSEYVHAMGYDRFAERLIRDFPAERQGILQFCDLLSEVGETISPQWLHEGVFSKGAARFVSRSAADTIDAMVTHPMLRRVLAGNTCLYAGDRQTTSLYEYGVITHSNIQGAYLLAKGSQQLVDALTKRILSVGSHIMTQTEVTRFELKGDRVDYVQTADGARIHADHFISAIHPAQTFALLYNNNVVRKTFISRIKTLPNTYGFFTTYLLLNPKTISYINHNVFMFNTPDVWSSHGEWHGCDIPMTLMSMHPDDSGAYAGVITLLTPMHWDTLQPWAETRSGSRGTLYQEFKEVFAQAVTDFVCTHFPHIRRGIHKICTASLLTYRDYTSTPEGSAYGLIKDYRHPAAYHLAAQTKIKNLLITGQNLNLHGCLGTTISAAVTASEILGKEYLAKKIGNA